MQSSVIISAMVDSHSTWRPGIAQGAHAEQCRFGFSSARLSVFQPALPGNTPTAGRLIPAAPIHR
jgi:hypothetical protein